MTTSPLASPIATVWPSRLTPAPEAGTGSTIRRTTCAVLGSTSTASRVPSAMPSTLSPAA
jgi:hypothetical protein